MSVVRPAARARRAARPAIGPSDVTRTLRWERPSRKENTDQDAPLRAAETRCSGGRCRLAGRSTLRRAPDLRFVPAGAEQRVFLPASRVDLLEEGLRAGVEGGVAAVDRP